jgi:transposase
MFGRETRMLLRHYLEQGASKSALAREVGRQPVEARLAAYPELSAVRLLDEIRAGVPQELLFDQMKAVITRDLRLEGGALVRNAELSPRRFRLRAYVSA